MEVIVSGKLQYKAILLSIACSFLSDTVCHFLGVNHILYSIEIIPQFNIINAIYTSFAGVAFGSAAFLFITFVNICNKFFVNSISNNYLRPFVGGLIIFPIFYFSNNLKYCGLGIEEIQSSFSVNVGRLDFFKKLILTSLTLGSGFKGGEVTPLFYIGSTLGNSLSNFIPLPIGLLAGLGFVSVFGASANTPITTTVLAIEIFGIEIANYAIIACFISYFVSGKIGIYSSQNSNGKYSIFFIIWKKIKDKFELKRL